MQLGSVMLAGKTIVEEDGEKGRHFVVNFGVGWLGQAEKHLEKFRCDRPGNDLAERPIGLLVIAVLQRKGEDVYKRQACM